MKKTIGTILEKRGILPEDRDGAIEMVMEILERKSPGILEKIQKISEGEEDQLKIRVTEAALDEAIAIAFESAVDGDEMTEQELEDAYWEEMAEFEEREREGEVKRRS